MKKRLTAALIAIAMIPITACAQTEDDSWKDNTGSIDLDALTTDADGAAFDGTTVVITKGGDYTVTGTLDDGMIYVDTDEKVKIRLSGASITNSTGAAIYFAQSEKSFITLTAGTENYLEDGAEYTSTLSAEAKGTIFSESDIEIKGSGSLTIVSNYGHGICSDDDISIEEGEITVESAAKDGLHANDSVEILDGTIVLNVTDDGIQTENDTITIDGGTLTITADTGKGITGYGNVTINGGDIDILKSTEGIESKSDMIINGGDIDITASDDGLNTGGGAGMGMGGGMGGGGMMNRDNTSATPDPDAIANSDDNAQQPMGGGMGGGMHGGMMQNGEAPEPPTDTDGEAPELPTGTQEPMQDKGMTQGGMGGRGQMQGDMTQGDIAQGDMGGRGQMQGDMTQGGMTQGGMTQGGMDRGQMGGGEMPQDINGQKQGGMTQGDMTQGGMTQGGMGKGQMGGMRGGDAMQIPENGMIPDTSATVNPDATAAPQSTDTTHTSGRGQMMTADTDDNDDTRDSGTHEMYINGGTLYINAQGDGIDSNGDIYITGGTITVDGPTNGGNGALDAGDGSYGIYVSGGTLIAAGSLGMVEAPSSNSEQPVVNISLSTSAGAGSQIQIIDSDANIVMDYTPAKSVQSVIFSSAELTTGESYTIYVDGSVEDEFTIESNLTTVGSGSGMGMSGGGRGQSMGGGGKAQDTSSAAQTTSNISVNINGQSVAFDQSPLIINSRTMVPLRAIFEALGINVDWDEATQTITAVSSGKSITIIVGSNTATVNGEAVTLDTEAQIVGGRTLVPVRFVAESLGMTVDWDEASQTVNISGTVL